MVGYVQKFDVFSHENTKMLIPKTALFELWSKSGKKKPKGTTLYFVKKRKQNGISTDKIDILNNFHKTWCSSVNSKILTFFPKKTPKC